MGKTQLGSGIGILTEFTDVIYLSDKTHLPGEIRRLLRQKRLSSLLMPLEGYRLIHLRPDLVGTVVIDAEGSDVTQDRRMGRIIETLERDNIGIILLTQRVKCPVRSFSLVPSESSFSMSGSVEAISLDALWARISVNLAYRKEQNSGIAVKLPTTTSAMERHLVKRPNPPAEGTDAISDNLKEQLRLAGLVQRDFLPSKLPNCTEAQWATSFIPAEWVSGDIYDVARIDEQHIGFYIADAVGHSMPAALLTIFIKHALVMRETTNNSYRIFSPTEAIANLNMKMLGQKLSGYQFATCCYCLLNIKTRQLTLARAGHPYPILLRQGQAPRPLETRGSLLGVFESAEFTQTTTQLQVGDRLLLYSDGAETLIGRLEDKNGFRFTDEFLAVQDASITEIVDRLTEIAKTRDIDPAEVDDFTLVGLEIP
ncbi:MAG: serine/threonine-protein phosphatase [Sedimentisphaerales bacterium]|nr:serine/threonine-protein phosphatase [Sedimentisphaerales bacterium]